MGFSPSLLAGGFALLLFTASPHLGPPSSAILGPPSSPRSAPPSSPHLSPLSSRLQVGDSLLTYRGDPPPDIPTIVSLRERFIYEVSFGLLTLGTVDVQLHPVDPADLSPRVVELAAGLTAAVPASQPRSGPSASTPPISSEPTFHRLDMTIRSNPTIPFVGDRRVRYSSLFMVRDSLFHDIRFWRDDLHDDEFERALVEFHHGSGQVYFFERGVAQDTLPIVEPASGGSLIFLHSRTYAESRERYLLNIFLENERAEIWANGHPEPVTRSYKAFDKPIPVYLSSGSTNVDGPFGFSGEFKSWFSADDLRVPVEAWVRIFVGSVKVRLLEYQRDDPAAV